MEAHSHLDLKSEFFVDRRNRTFYEGFYFDEGSKQEIVRLGQFVDILLNDSGSGNTQDQWGLGEVLVVFSNHKGEKFAEVRWLVHLREVLDREFVRRFLFFSFFSLPFQTRYTRLYVLFSLFEATSLYLNVQ